MQSHFCNFLILLSYALQFYRDILRFAGPLFLSFILLHDKFNHTFGMQHLVSKREHKLEGDMPKEEKAHEEREAMKRLNQNRKQDTMEKRGTTRHCDQARNEEPCKVRERITSSTGSNMQKTSQFDQGCLVWRTTLS